MQTSKVRRHLLLGLASLLAMAGAASGQVAKETGMPEGIVRSLVEAMRANDAARIRAAFATTAVQAYGNGAAKTGEAFSKWLQSDIIDRHGQVDDARLVVTGNDVVVTGRYRNNAGYTSPANFLFKVANGRIVSWQMRY